MVLSASKSVSRLGSPAVMMNSSGVRKKQDLKESPEGHTQSPTLQATYPNKSSVAAALGCALLSPAEACSRHSRPPGHTCFPFFTCSLSFHKSLLFPCHLLDAWCHPSPIILSIYPFVPYLVYVPGSRDSEF